MAAARAPRPRRSEEHTSELQSRGHLVCRLLLEKKKHPARPLRTRALALRVPACHSPRPVFLHFASARSPPLPTRPVFFFNDTATTEIYTLSLHDALPISDAAAGARHRPAPLPGRPRHPLRRSEEHTSELQSRGHLVCRLLLEKKKKQQIRPTAQNKKRQKARQST